jgi:hypothetical protein
VRGELNASRQRTSAPPLRRDGFTVVTVLRGVEVPFDIRLDRLHLTIQAAMG